VTYKVLIIEEDVALQGFLERLYNVIITNNVLHATADLRKCLQNLKKLLKPGEKIFIKEIPTSMRAITGFYPVFYPVGGEQWRMNE
jgi:2-polyprenyl-3-methyl-5-hydroxy-6-metoxy-1,4-benzoquinol methylase